MIQPSRRDFLQTAAGAMVSAGALSSGAKLGLAATAEQPKFIDAHTHFYDPTRPQGAPWPPKDNKLLYRKVLPADLQQVAGPQLAGTVVIEASSWVEDNAWILDLAAENPLIVGFVGHLTPGEPEFAAQLTRFASNRLFRGIRIQVKQLHDGLTEPRFMDDLRRMADLDLELDVNGGPDTPAEAAALAERMPGFRIVINHVGNVRVDGKNVPPAWAAGMRAAGRHPQVFCKVSSLVEGTGHQDGKAPADLSFYRPVLDTVWEAFGEDRLIYGSNWPVSDRGAPYATVLAIVRDYFTARGEAVAQKFFYANSQAAYKWIAR